MKIGFDQVLKNFQWLKNASVLLTASKFSKFSAEASTIFVKQQTLF